MTVLEAEPGETIERFSDRLIRKAKNSLMVNAAYGKFNGTELCAYYDSTVREICYQYMAKRK